MPQEASFLMMATLPNPSRDSTDKSFLSNLPTTNSVEKVAGKLEAVSRKAHCEVWVVGGFASESAVTFSFISKSKDIHINTPPTVMTFIPLYRSPSPRKHNWMSPSSKRRHAKVPIIVAKICCIVLQPSGNRGCRKVGGGELASSPLDRMTVLCPRQQIGVSTSPGTPLCSAGESMQAPPYPFGQPY